MHSSECKGKDAASDCGPGPGCLLWRGVSLPRDRGEAAQDGDPHILQQDVPGVLPHRLCHGQHRDILPLQAVE